MNVGVPDADAIARQEFLRQAMESALYKNLIVFLERMLGQKESAREIAQNTYLEFYRQVKPKDVNCPRALLFDAATKLAIIRIRHQRAGAVGTSAVADSSVETVLERSFRPERFAANERLGLYIGQTVEKLPPDLKEVFTMRYVKQIPLPEIAERLNLSVDSVEQSLTRALVACRRELPESDIESMN